MCGIAGFCLNPADTHINARRLAFHLLLGIEERGRDATGAAWYNRNHHLITQKRDVTAQKFVSGLSMDKRSQVAILHTRMWTQGKPENPLNNHPIHAGDIIGVHNGTVSNDPHLLRLAEAEGYKRRGEVDSEAIFATLNRVDDKFTLLDALEAPEARMALAWLDVNDKPNVLHLARGDGSPLVLAQTKNGSLIFASTSEAIIAAAAACNIDLPYMESTKEGTYMKVSDGIITELQKFQPTPQWSYYTGRSSGTGTYAVRSTTPPAPAIVKQHQSSYMDLRFLDPDTEVPEMSSDAFNSQYKDRVKAITEWIEVHAYIDGNEVTDDHAIFSKAAERGAFLRPGMWVQTLFCGQWLDAQVYRVPKTFPEGDYILRVLVPYEAEYGADPNEVYYEPILLARSVLDMDGPELYWDAPKASDKDDAEVLELTR